MGGRCTTAEEQRPPVGFAGTRESRASGTFGEGAARARGATDRATARVVLPDPPFCEIRAIDASHGKQFSSLADLR